MKIYLMCLKDAVIVFRDASLDVCRCAKEDALKVARYRINWYRVRRKTFRLRWRWFLIRRTFLSNQMIRMSKEEQEWAYLCTEERFH